MNVYESFTLKLYNLTNNVLNCLLLAELIFKWFKNVYMYEMFILK